MARGRAGERADTESPRPRVAQIVIHSTNPGLGRVVRAAAHDTRRYVATDHAQVTLGIFGARLASVGGRFMLGEELDLFLCDLDWEVATSTIRRVGGENDERRRCHAPIKELRLSIPIRRDGNAETQCRGAQAQTLGFLNPRGSRRNATWATPTMLEALGSIGVSPK